MSVLIVDYEMGNLFSVKKMLDNLFVKSVISNKQDDILKADKIILPGVGSFHKAMDNLKKLNLIDSLNEAVKVKRKPFLGICLGMQLMAKSSSEGKETEGLGWIDAIVEPLSKKEGFRIPHMGWNNVNIQKESPLLQDFHGEPTFYFTHSFVLKSNDHQHVVATCDYGTPFPVVVHQDNLFGTQFHPEKSQIHGKILIENFINWRG